MEDYYDINSREYAIDEHLNMAMSLLLEHSCPDDPHIEEINDILNERRSSRLSSGQGITDYLQTNPYSRIIIKPTYYGVSNTVIDFFIQLFSGYIWECKNSPNIVGKHQEINECEILRNQLIWLKNKKESWPQEQEMEALALIDVIRMVPKMWD